MDETKEKINNYTILKILIIVITAVSLFCAGIILQKSVKTIPGNIYGCGGTIDTPQRDYQECIKLHEIADREAKEAEMFLKDYTPIFFSIGIVCLIANIVIFVIIRKKHIIIRNIYTYLEGASFAASIFLTLCIF